MKELTIQQLIYHHLLLHNYYLKNNPLNNLEINQLLIINIKLQHFILNQLFNLQKQILIYILILNNQVFSNNQITSNQFIIKKQCNAHLFHLFQLLQTRREINLVFKM